jgi:hypothetical protein
MGIAVRIPIGHRVKTVTRIRTLRLADGPDAVTMRNDRFIYGVHRMMMAW